MSRPKIPNECTEHRWGGVDPCPKCDDGERYHAKHRDPCDGHDGCGMCDVCDARQLGFHECNCEQVLKLKVELEQARGALVASEAEVEKLKSISVSNLRSRLRSLGIDV